MLRRTKTEVLSDLPPKIIQDYLCDLSPLQMRLYNDFAVKQKGGEMVCVPMRMRMCMCVSVHAVGTQTCDDCCSGLCMVSRADIGWHGCMRADST
jgi:hypothetical protein